MKRKLFYTIIVVLVLFSSFLLSGCLEGHMHVSFNADGSADIDFLLLASSAMGLLEGQGMDIFADIKSDMVIDGFTLEEEKTPDKKGFRGKKSIDSIDELYELTFLGDMEPPEVVITDKLFFRIYEISHDMKLSLPGMGEDSEAFAKLLNPDLQFILTFPIPPVSHNADDVLDDGRTVVWNIGADEATPVTVVVNVPLFPRIIMLVVGIVLLIVLIILFFTIRKKRKTAVY